MLLQTQWAPGAVPLDINLEWHGFSSVLQRSTESLNIERLRAPWRGFGTTCLRWGPYQFLNLWTKDVLTNYVPISSHDQHRSVYFATKFIIGATAGVLSALVWGYPLDVIRQHLATHNAIKPALASNVILEVWQKHGMLGFYRGFLGDCTGLAIFRGVQLGGWDAVKDWYGKDAWHKQSMLSHFLHAQGISLLGSLCSHPVDTIRRNVIRSGSGISYMDCLSSGVKMGGGYMRYFYAGFSARIASSFVNGVMLECWDRTKTQGRGH